MYIVLRCQLSVAGDLFYQVEQSNPLISPKWRQIKWKDPTRGKRMKKRIWPR